MRPIARIRRIGTGAAVAASIALSAGIASAETLSDTLVQAYRSSPLLAQQRLLLRATDEDVAVAVAALRPTVGASASYGKITRDGPLVDGTDTQATLALVIDYLLLDGGQRSLQIGAAKEAVLAARFNLIQQEQNVLLDAITAYLELREALLTVDVRESNQRLLAEQLRAARDRFEVGEVTRTDVSIAEARLANARSLLAAARGQVDIQREQYRLTVGELPVGVLAPPPPGPAIPPDVSRAQALALQIHPLITAGQHEIASLTLLADAAGADRLPTISMSGQVQRDRPENDSARLSIQTDIPIYTGGRLSAIERRAIARAQAARAELALTARQITDAVGEAYSRLQIAEAQIIATREGVRAARLAFEGFQEEALLGARTTLDVLDAEQELLDARTALLEAETDAQLAVYQVLASVGLLTTDHLGLGVERFDPTDYYRAVSNAPAISPSPQGGRLDSVLRRFGRD
jgi:outer membrane protein